MDNESQDSSELMGGESAAESKDAFATEEAEEESQEEVNPTTLFTSEQLAFFRHMFDNIDVIKKGSIPPKYIPYVLRQMGFNPTKAESRKYISLADPEKKGLVSFVSFVIPMYDKVANDPETHEDIIAAFESLDEEELQYLTVEFLSEILTNYGEPFDDIELEIFFRVADPKNTGKVYYRDFVEKVFGVAKKTRKKGDKKKNQGKKGKTKKKPKK